MAYTISIAVFTWSTIKFEQQLEKNPKLGKMSVGGNLTPFGRMDSLEIMNQCL